jgi:signal transduction histidine kinase
LSFCPDEGASDQVDTLAGGRKVAQLTRRFLLLADDLESDRQRIVDELGHRAIGPQTGPDGRSSRLAAHVDELVRALRHGRVEGGSVIAATAADPETERAELRLLFDYIIDGVAAHRLNASPAELAVASEWYAGAERRRLLAENRYLAALLDGVDASAAIIAPNGRVSYINQRAGQVLYETCGLSRDEVVGQIYSELGIHELLGLAPSPGELLLRARSGESTEVVVWGRTKKATLQAVYGQSGDVAAVATIIQDIHGRKLAQRRLDLLSKLNALVGRLDYDKVAEEVARVPIPELADWCSVNLIRDGKIRRTFLAQRDPGKGPVRDALLRALPHWERHPLWRDMLTSGFQLLSEVNDDLIRLLTTTEEQFRMVSGLGIRSIMVLPLVSQGQDAGIMTLFYTTESGRRYGRDDPELAEELALHTAHALENARLMSELRSSRQHLAGALEFRERMMGILGHDLRNPLGVVAMAGESLLHRNDLPVEVREHAKRIDAATARMNEMIGTLLDFARARFLGRLPVTPVAADLDEIVRSVVDETRATHVDLDVELALSGDARGMWDPSRLSQMISNLLVNAVAYREPGTPAHVSVEAAPDDVTLRVTNRGPPIPAEILQLIFEPFRQGHYKSPRGLGLGLYIAKEIVLAHHGEIWVESTAKSGTTFTVRLPRSRPA